LQRNPTILGFGFSARIVLALSKENTGPN